MPVAATRIRHLLKKIKPDGLMTCAGSTPALSAKLNHHDSKLQQTAVTIIHPRMCCTVLLCQVRATDTNKLLNYMNNKDHDPMCICMWCAPHMYHRLTCNDHPVDVFGRTDMRFVAEAIGDLYYRSLSDLFQHLSKKLRSDGQLDEADGRSILANCLFLASNAIYTAYVRTEEAWAVSSPYMKPAWIQLQLFDPCIQ